MFAIYMCFRIGYLKYRLLFGGDKILRNITPYINFMDNIHQNEVFYFYYVIIV